MLDASLYVPIDNYNYDPCFRILAQLSDCEEILRKENITSEGYYVKFRWTEPDDLDISLDNGRKHLLSTRIRFGDFMKAGQNRSISRHIVDTIFDHKGWTEPEYHMFVRMQGNIYKNDLKCRLFLYNDERSFRINIYSSPKVTISDDVRKQALNHLDKHYWLNEHLVGSYI